MMHWGHVKAYGTLFALVHYPYTCHNINENKVNNKANVRLKAETLYARLINRESLDNASKLHLSVLRSFISNARKTCSISKT